MKPKGKNIPIGGVTFGKPADNCCGWTHTVYLGDERVALLQLVRNGDPLPDELFLLGQVTGGYERITADDINWSTSRVRPTK